MYYNINHLNLYGYILLNSWDVSRKMNILLNEEKAFYKYHGRLKVWFVNENFIEKIVKRSVPR